MLFFTRSFSSLLLLAVLSCSVASMAQDTTLQTKATTSQLVAAPIKSAEEVSSDDSDKVDSSMLYRAGVDDTSANSLSKGLGDAMDKAREFPNDPKAHFELAVLYSRSNYLLDALKEVKTARNLLVTQDDATFLQQTVQNYEKQAKKNPKSLMAWYRLGLAYYLEGYAIEKTKFGPKLKAFAPEPPAAYYNKSKNALQKALGINARDVYTKNYLGYIVFENDKNVPQAIKMWKESLAVDSNNNMAAYFLLANAYKKSGDFVNSLVYGAKALEIQSRLGKLPQS